MAAQPLVGKTLRSFAAYPACPLEAEQAGVAFATAVAFAVRTTVDPGLGSIPDYLGTVVVVGIGHVTASERLAAAEHLRHFLLKPLFLVDFGFLFYLSV